MTATAMTVRDGFSGGLSAELLDAAHGIRVDPPLRDERYALIGGVLEQWDGPTMEVVSPIRMNGAEIRLGSYPRLGAAVARRAVEAASAAYDNGLGEWPMMSAEQRIACMERFVDQMREQRDEITQLIMWEVAKPLDAARAEFDRTVDYIERSIDALQELEAASFKERIFGDTAAVIARSPRGVVLCTGPFNYPLNETFTTLIPALLMGNTAVMKPPKQGVLLFSPLMKAMQECFPPGALNVITGDGAEIVNPIMKSGKVDVLGFIGSDRVADIVSSSHPEPHRLWKILGLGAKNPAIVMPDADLDQVVDQCVQGALSFNGQRCTALKVLFVHRTIADDFSARFADAVSRLRCGMPWEPGVAVTPLAEPGKVQQMEAYIEDASMHGARVINNGGGTSRDTLMRPAVLYPISREARIYREEQFGPLVPIVPFDSLDEVIRELKGSKFRQQVSLFQNSAMIEGVTLRKLGRLYSRVNINAQCNRGPDEIPFSAKGSGGMGTLSIRDALLAFSTEEVITAAPGVFALRRYPARAN